MEADKKKMKFIRKNGRIIPIREKSKNPSIKEKSNEVMKAYKKGKITEEDYGKAEEATSRTRTVKERFKGAAGVGAFGSVYAGLIGGAIGLATRSGLKGSAKAAGLGAAAGGAIGALYGATSKHYSQTRAINKLYKDMKSKKKK